LDQRFQQVGNDLSLRLVRRGACAQQQRSQFGSQGGELGLAFLVGLGTPGSQHGIVARNGNPALLRRASQFEQQPRGGQLGRRNGDRHGCRVPRAQRNRDSESPLPRGGDVRSGAAASGSNVNESIGSFG